MFREEIARILTVPLVSELASTLSTSGWASPSLTTALSVKRSTSGRRSSASGSASSRGGRAGGGGSGGAARSGASGCRGDGTSSREGGSDITKLDVGEDNKGVGLLRFHIGGDTGGGGARSTKDTGVGGGLVERIGAVEPQHVGRIVVPDGHDQDHSLGEGTSHLGHTTQAGEDVGITEGGLLSSAELVAERVPLSHSGDVDLGVLEDDTVLDVDAADLLECARGSTSGGQELSDNGHLLGGVDFLGRAVV